MAVKRFSDLFYLQKTAIPWEFDFENFAQILKLRGGTHMGGCLILKIRGILEIRDIYLISCQPTVSNSVSNITKL